MNSKAVENYLTQLERAKQAIKRLDQYVDDFGEVGPNEVTYAHAGSMEHLANELEQLKDMVDGTGEYAR